MPSSGLVLFRLTVRRILDLKSCVRTEEVTTVEISMMLDACPFLFSVGLMHVPPRYNCLPGAFIGNKPTLCVEIPDALGFSDL